MKNTAVLFIQRSVAIIVKLIEILLGTNFHAKKGRKEEVEHNSQEDILGLGYTSSFVMFCRTNCMKIYWGVCGLFPLPGLAEFPLVV